METSINNLFSDNVNAGPAKQAMNIVIKDIFRSLKFREFGRLAKFYNPDLAEKVPGHDIEVLRGFYSTFRVVWDETQ